MEKTKMPSAQAEKKLAAWNRAAAALPLVDVLDGQLAMTRLWYGETGCPVRPVVIATRQEVRPYFEKDIPGNPLDWRFERLGAEGGMQCVRALWPSTETTEVSIIGQEAEALMDLRRNFKIGKDIGEFPNPRGWASVDRLRLSCERARAWKKETMAGLRGHIKGKEITALPRSVFDCVSKSDLEAKVLERIFTEPELLAAGFEPDSLPPRGLLQKGVKVELYERLERACDAFAAAYVLNCAAKIFSDSEIRGIRAMEEFGLQQVQQYAVLSKALASGNPSKPERLVRRMVELVGPDAEDEVRGSFPIAKRVVVAVGVGTQKGEAAEREQKEPAPREEPARVAQRSRDSVLALLKTLEGIPVSFVRKCFQQGVRDANGIMEKYTAPTGEPRARRETRRHVARGTDAPPAAEAAEIDAPRSLEERIARIRFEGMAGGAMRQRGIEPGHVGFLICKIFGYPHSGVRSHDESEARAGLRRHLNGSKNAGKTVDAVFRFMQDAGLIKANARAARPGIIVLNTGSSDPVGREILAAMRAEFGP